MFSPLKVQQLNETEFVIFFQILIKLRDNLIFIYTQICTMIILERYILELITFVLNYNIVRYVWHTYLDDTWLQYNSLYIYIY
jgi:hypothetical protein